MNKSIVWADLPSCGLGNKLLVWAQAYWFSKSRAVPIVTSGWSNSSGIRTWLKGGGWRRYAGDFATSSLACRVTTQLSKALKGSVDEPELEIALQADKVYRFNKVPHWSDYFGYFNRGREVVLQGLWDLLNEPTKRRIEDSLKPEIAVHVRHGDFRPLKPGEEFAKVGLVRTSNDYFVSVIRGLRAVAGNDVPVTLFSDGKDKDLQDILSLGNITRAENNSAIIDIYRMARSKVLVCSAGSTFSYWSCFIGGQPTILHRDHIHKPLRTAEWNESSFEGGVAEQVESWPSLLIKNIQDIQWTN
ncbi:MAG: hypothetical protein U0930_12625 [Pirellulales bacterium]